MESYQGKVAFVTGAAGGIGLALARSLGRRGAKVMLADRNADALESSCNSLKESGIDAEFVACDVSSIDHVRNAAKATLNRFGKVHIVVNNAGVSLGGPTGDIAIEDWNWIVNINLMGVVHGVETFTPIMLEQGEGGCIINTASMAGHLAITGGAPYTATKYAVVGYSESIRQELTSQGIEVHVLCPGWVKTAINETSQGRPSLQAGGIEREKTEEGEQIAAAINAGLDPDVVAEWTLSQIDNNRFYIFTSPELQPFAEARFAEIKDDLEAAKKIADLALTSTAQSGGAPLDVLIIGAGFSGVCAAIRLKQNGISNFKVYDKSKGIGGTWWLNTYPGAACDVQSHFYCYSFELYPEWSRLYALQPEIQKYIEHCVDKYGVRDRINLGHEITGLQFDEETSLWVATFADGKTVRSRFVINATGGLHQPKIPDFEGREAFSGTQMHTARWDHDFDATDKRVAVIGSAASAIQTVPQLAKTATLVTLFQRTPNYIAPREDFAYSDEEKSAFREIPQKMQDVRDEVFNDRDTRLYPIVVNPFIRKHAANDIKNYMRSQITDPELQEKLMPDYELGCKRILISDDFLPALNQKNVQVETSGIGHITPEGIVTGNGEAKAYDAIIYATGFDIDSHKLGLEIIGPNGVSLADAWKSQADAYKAAMIPPMPNYFMVTGPNAGVGTTSVVYLIEQSVEWIIDVIKMTGRQKLVSVTKEACMKFSEGIHQQLENTVWASGCDSWYLSANGRNEALFPGNAQDFADQMSTVDPEDFALTEIKTAEELPEPNWTPRRDGSAGDLGPTRKLDPTIKAIMVSAASKNEKRMHEMEVAEAREYFKGMVAKLEAPISISCNVENGQMQLQGRDLEYRIYRPHSAQEKSPAMVFFHGGGWVIGDLDTHDNSCRALANESGICVISVDYRRAPEHPFPGPVYDGYDAFVWVVENATKLGFDTARVGIGGDSAGGNIAAVVTQLLRSRNGPSCAWQLLIYPSTAAYHETGSSKDFQEGFGLDRTIQEWFAYHYIPKGTDIHDPLLSPLKAESLAELPPAIIATAGFDPLRDAGHEYAQKLEAHGVSVSYVEYPDLIHGFKSWAGIIPSASVALKDIADRVSALAEELNKSSNRSKETA